MIKLKTFGLARVQASMRNIAEKVTDAARSQLHRSAERVTREAKINTPEDDELLVDSIRVDKTYGYRGRLQIDVIAGGETVLGPDGDVNLDQYAALVHEAYESEVANVNGPGEKTLAKMQKYPGRVGSKFLERALEDEEPRLERHIIESNTRIIEGETK